MRAKIISVVTIHKFKPQICNLSLQSKTMSFGPFEQLVVAESVNTC